MPYLLIVDDDEDFASTTATVLRKEGYDVQVELDIESAVKSMESKPPDLAILDVMFPENASAGFELARSMRHKSGKLKNIPILMLTAINTKFPLGFGPKDIDESWMPVTEFLEKPVDFDVLREKVAKLLSSNSADD
ncbi:MAG: response regulator [Planctomycetes bacterium]|nr:response regulator [Planctomycetota bacterium]MBL7144905.1 response regulator [Phycisphaerae bacterium]